MAGNLHVSSLSAGYRGRRVLHELSLAPFASGTLNAIVGPNGAGKSTLLRALAGLVPASGSVRTGDIDLLQLSSAERARHVGFMPQSLPRGVELTVLEGVIGAISVSAGVFSANGREIRRKAIGVLERLDIADLAMERLDQLSGGQRQLASLAQTIARDPPLLLLDEPTSALDLRHQLDVMEVVRSLVSEGSIVVAVLHDLTLAARWADHIVMLRNGRVHSEGRPEQAVTPETLAQVYGVRARVERCSHGYLQITADGRFTADRPSAAT